MDIAIPWQHAHCSWDEFRNTDFYPQPTFWRCQHCQKPWLMLPSSLIQGKQPAGNGCRWCWSRHPPPLRCVKTAIFHTVCLSPGTNQAFQVHKSDWLVNRSAHNYSPSCTIFHRLLSCFPALAINFWTFLQRVKWGHFKCNQMNGRTPWASFSAFGLEETDHHA